MTALAQDSFDLGEALWAEGNLDLARHWLARAVHYGHPQAADRLAVLDQLYDEMADLDDLSVIIDHMLGAP